VWVRCLVDLWRRHKRPFFRGFLAGGTANTTSVNREPENMNNRMNLERLGRHESNGTE